MKLKPLIISFIILGSLNSSWGKAEKTGVIEKNIFSDSKYNYQFTIPSSWKGKIEKEPSPIRVILQKTKIEKYGSAYFTQGQESIPSLFVCVDTTSLEPDSFCKLIVENPKKLPNSQIYLYRLELLTSSEVVDREKLEIDKLPAQKIYLRKRYFKPVKDPRAGYGERDNTTLVEDFLLGFVVVFKKENKMFFIHCSGDREIFRINEEEWMQLLASWKFNKPSQ